jgi:putative FmdB family regulatory protein
MPLYDLKCNDCENIFSVMCTYADRPSKECTTCKSTNHEPHLTGMPAFGDPVRLGIRHTDNGFKEVLSKIHQNNYRSNLSDKLSRR